MREHAFTLPLARETSLVSPYNRPRNKFVFTYNARFVAFDQKKQPQFNFKHMYARRVFFFTHAANECATSYEDVNFFFIEKTSNSPFSTRDFFANTYGSCISPDERPVSSSCDRSSSRDFFFTKTFLTAGGPFTADALLLVNSARILRARQRERKRKISPSQEEFSFQEGTHAETHNVRGTRFAACASRVRARARAKSDR